MDLYDQLSVNAKAICGGMFQFGPKCVVTFHTPERMSPEARAAFDELHDAGLLSREPFNQFGGLVYRPVDERASDIGRQFARKTSVKKWPSFPIVVEAAR